MTSRNLLQSLHDRDRTSPRFHEQLVDFLHGNRYRDAVPSLQSEDLAWLVEYLDSVSVQTTSPRSVLNTGVGPRWYFRPHKPRIPRITARTRNICGVKDVLPKSCVLSHYVPDVSLPPAFGCVHEGTLDGSKVRVRRIGMCPKGDLQKASEVCIQCRIFPFPVPDESHRLSTRLSWRGNTWHNQTSSPSWVLLLIHSNSFRIGCQAVT